MYSQRLMWPLSHVNWKKTLGRGRQRGGSVGPSAMEVGVEYRI